jgi:hypothetical protein
MRNYQSPRRTEGTECCLLQSLTEIQKNMQQGQISSNMGKIPSRKRSLSIKNQTSSDDTDTTTNSSSQNTTTSDESISNGSKPSSRHKKKKKISKDYLQGEF